MFEFFLLFKEKSGNSEIKLNEMHVRRICHFSSEKTYSHTHKKKKKEKKKVYIYLNIRNAD